MLAFGQDQIEEVEKAQGADAVLSRQRIKKAIEQRYTAPT